MPRPWCASATTKATSASSRARAPLVAADRDDLPGQLGDERDPVVMVDVGEPVQVAFRDARIGGEVAQIAGAVRQRRRERRRAPSASAGRIGRRCTVAAVGDDHVGFPVRQEAAGRPASVTGIVRVQPEQREAGAAGRADRAVQPGLATRHPCVDMRLLPAALAHRRRQRRRAPRARAACAAHAAGIRRLRRHRTPLASASRCVQVRGTQRTRPYPPPPKATQRPPADLVREPVQRGDRGALAVDGQLQVGERVLVVGVAAALGDEHVRAEGAHRARDHRAERAQPAGVVGARRQRDVDRGALGRAGADLVGEVRCRETGCADPDAG